LKLRLPGGYQREQRRLWQLINESDRWRLEPGPQRQAMEREFASYLDSISDPELKRNLTPDYNLGCTRIPKSDRNYYEAVQLPNAHIVKGEITGIVTDGVIMADGTHVGLDVLVYATGFDAHGYMRPMAVTGLNGATIAEAWKDKIYSYGGIALPGFPNLFMLYGPFAPVNNVPVPLGLDQEIACIMRLIVEARARRAAVAPTVAVTEKFLSVPPFPVPFGWAVARTGIPAIRARRSCGRCRRASTRRSSTKYRWKIFSSSLPGRETELTSRPKSRSDQ
jgi:cation diffusion facilitator CzcD-associated flavoprotein CzcO